MHRPRRARPTPWVLLHGFAGAPHGWQPVADALDDGNGVAGVALPGHHPDVAVAGSFEANVDAVARALHRVELDRCELVGYSLGARLALALALRHPDIPVRLSLIGVNPGVDEDARADRRRADDRWIRVLRDEGIEEFAGQWQEQPIFASQRELSPRVLAEQHATRLSHDPEALARSLKTMGLGAMPDYRPRLGELTMPVRLVVGARDDKFVAIARDMIHRNPAFDLHIVEGSGHNPVLERPHTLADVLRSP